MTDEKKYIPLKGRARELEIRRRAANVMYPDVWTEDGRVSSWSIGFETGLDTAFRIAGEDGRDHLTPEAYRFAEEELRAEDERKTRDIPF